MDLPEGKAFQAYALASVANDLSAVPQLLAFLPQLTVLAGQIHKVAHRRT